jgi:hypothetical protein
VFPGLAEVLANREWLLRPRPFPHIIAWNVFRPSFYAQLAREIQSVLDLQLSEVPDRHRFSRAIPGYDSYGIGFPERQTGALSLFLTPEWRDMISRLFGITPTPYVFAGAHHHTPGSENGFIHSDFNPVWFPVAENDRIIRTPNHEICAYKTGAGSLADSQKIQVVRGAAVIFYLVNDGWKSDDGGETGLYDSPRRGVAAPLVRVPPENNTLVAFECTPQSFHTFLANPRRPRTSVIMWVHRPLEEAVARFGEERLERWK